MLLHQSAEGDREAFHRLIPLVYGDLKGIARRRLRDERDNHTLDTTDIVHEAYLQLVPQATATWQNRVHFFAVAARVIRHVLIDYARHRGAEKRGGSSIKVPLREDLQGEGERTVELLALDEALESLAEKDPRLRDVVECRFFAGMTMKETAEALDVSKRTAERDWTRARTYLYRALAG
jgi:RNA polymerase sigma factor (TIGR02999 family)